MSEPTHINHINRDVAPARLPARHLGEATPYLQAPFTPQTIGMFVRRRRRDRDTARVVFFIPIDEAEGRLCFVAGARGWSLGRPSVIDADSLSCSMTLFGATQSEVGQGIDRRSQSVNGAKGCALHFGLGRYLKAIAPLNLPIGTGKQQVPIGADGEPVLTAPVTMLAREHYARELERLAPRYGPALAHPQTPWNSRLPLGRRRDLAVLATSLLDRAERHGPLPVSVRVPAAALLARAPRGLRAYISARRNAATPPAGERDAPALRVLPDLRPPATEMIEIDFAELGPRPMRWAA